MSPGEKLYRFLCSSEWIPQRLQRHLYKRLARGGSAPDIPFVTDFFGLQYRGNLNNNIDFNIYFYGAFEKPLLFFLRDTLDALGGAHSVFVDVGANVGQHSLFMSAQGVQVHAFEPFGVVREQFLEQISTNHLNNISVYPVGLSNENISLPFFAPTGTNAGIGSFDGGVVSSASP